MQSELSPAISPSGIDSPLDKPFCQHLKNSRTCTVTLPFVHFCSFQKRQFDVCVDYPSLSLVLHTVYGNDH